MPGLVRSLISSAIEAATAPPADVRQQQQQQAAPPVTGGAYAAPPPPPADMGGRKEGGVRSTLEPLKGYEKKGGSRLVGRWLNIFAMCQQGRKRRSECIDPFQGLAFSLIIIGAIFLGLSASGNYMGSVETMKAAGLYSITIAKYSLYIGTGLIGVWTALAVRRALWYRKPLTFAKLLCWVSILCVLATLGLSIYVLTKSAEYNPTWWSWLLNILMILQRLLYLICGGMLIYTLNEVGNNPTYRDEMMHNFPGYTNIYTANGGAKDDKSGYNVV